MFDGVMFNGNDEGVILRECIVRGANVHHLCSAESFEEVSSGDHWCSKSCYDHSKGVREQAIDEHIILPPIYNEDAFHENVSGSCTQYVSNDYILPHIFSQETGMNDISQQQSNRKSFMELLHGETPLAANHTENDEINDNDASSTDGEYKTLVNDPFDTIDGDELEEDRQLESRPNTETIQSILEPIQFTCNMIRNLQIQDGIGIKVDVPNLFMNQSRIKNRAITATKRPVEVFLQLLPISFWREVVSRSNKYRQRNYPTIQVFTLEKLIPVS